MRLALTLRSLLCGAALLTSLADAQERGTAPVSARFVPAKSADQADGRVSDFGHIQIKGEITRDTPGQFLSALQEARRLSPNKSFGGQQVIYVFLDSPGGNVGAAVAVGRMIRANAARTWVDRGASCSSACIFILAGGVDRWAVPEARLGLHRPFFDQKQFANLSHQESQKLYGRLSAAVRSYLLEMGIAAELYEMMIHVPSEDLLELDHDVAEQTSLLGKDPAFEEWDLARYKQLVSAFERCMALRNSEIECQTQLRPTSRRR
jgi:ATP-dependent protease ClpP protease subunit